MRCVVRRLARIAHLLLRGCAPAKKTSATHCWLFAHPSEALTQTHTPPPQIWILEKDGGSLVGGAIKLFQDRRANPPPPRDARLPPKPQGQTVGSFRNGLKTLPEAIGAKLVGGWLAWLQSSGFWM